MINIGNGDNRSINDIFGDMIGGDRINVEPVIEPKLTLFTDNSKIMSKPTQNIEDWKNIRKKWD